MRGGLPKEISISNIARFNREFLKASFVSPEKMGETPKTREEE